MIFANTKFEPRDDGSGLTDVGITVSPAKKALEEQQVILCIVAAGRPLEENKALTDAQFFAVAVDSITGIITELPPAKGKHAGPIITHAYFTDLRAAGHVEAMAWTLREASGDAEAKAWIGAHEAAVAAYRTWTDGWSYTTRSSRPGDGAGTQSGKP